MRAPRIIALGTVAALGLAGCGLTDARNAAIANAKVKPVSLADALRPGLVGIAGYPSTGWEASSASPAPLSVQATLTRIGITSADLMTGLTVKTMPDGTSLGIPTLDFCNATYPSESLRVARLQRGAYDAQGAYAGLSTEVVVYRTAADAQQALREVTAARLGCPVGTVVKTFDGHKISFAFHPAPGPASTPLVPAADRLIVHTTMRVDGAPQTALLVYQIDGRVLAAMYAMDASGKPFPQTSLDAFFSLAGIIATRLQQYAPTLAG